MPKQPIGEPVNPLPPLRFPDLRSIPGQWMSLEPLQAAKHGAALYKSFVGRDATLWTYMPYGPFESDTMFQSWLTEREQTRDPWFHTYCNRKTGTPMGMGAFMRADPKNGVIEIGNIWMSPDLQKTREATEVIYLMMEYAFEDLGVRRLEWKCDSLNAPSRKAAQRFGFTFEGIFRQHMIIKGRNRDTAWFAMMDHEWPEARRAFKAWLQSDNFDTTGKQISRLTAQRST